MESVTQGYQPLDLLAIQKSLPKNFKKINTDKELEAETVEICSVLKDLVTDWKKRLEACQKIQAIAFLFDGVCSGALPKININTYITQVNKFANVLGIQVHDLRSMSAKSAGVAIQVLAQNLGNDFEVLALKLITKEVLLKVLHSGNKTLSDIAHQSLLTILNHVCVPKLIPRLQVEMANSKSTHFHAKMSQYLFVLVTIYPFDGVLDKNAASIDAFISQCVSDANSDSRQNGRKSFLVWQKLAPENAQNLFSVMDYQAQKAIIDEQDRFGAMEQYEEPKPKKQMEQKQMASGGPRKKDGRGSKQRAKEVSQNRQSLGVFSQKSDDKNLVANAGQTPYNFENKQTSGNVRTSQGRHHTEKPLPKPNQNQNQNQQYQNPFDGGHIDFYENQQQQPQYEHQEDKISRKEKAMEDEDNVQEIFGINKRGNRELVKRADEEMDIEPVIGGQTHYVFSYQRIQKMLKSHMWSQRAQALEDFLRYLIEMQPAELMNQLKNEKDFSILVDQIIQKLDTETVIKIIEISLDLIELLLSSLPECLISSITAVILCFLKQLSSRREMIAEKANDLINLARETLGADFLLPHFVAILNDMSNDTQQLKTKISALEVLNVLIKESESLEEKNQESYVQYAAVVKTLGSIIKIHSSHRGIINPVIGAILSLRDKNMNITFKAIQEELSHTQYTILKQILNAHEKTLAKQLMEYNQQLEQPERKSKGRTESRQKSVSSANGMQRTSYNPAENEAKKQQQQQLAQQQQQQQTPQIIGIENYKPQHVINVEQQQQQKMPNSPYLKQAQQILIMQCQMLKSGQNTQQCLKNIQGVIVPKEIRSENHEADEQENQMNKQVCAQLISYNFDVLVESMLYVMMQNQNFESNIRNSCIEILTYVIKINHRKNQNQVLSAKNLERFRDEILQATLRAYSPDIAPQHQCITNQVAEDLLEQLVISCDTDFLSQTIEPLLRSEQPPRLQALLRMVQNKLRYIQKMQEQQPDKPILTPFEGQKLIDNLQCLADVLANQMGNPNADVRKSVVFCMVEIHSIIADDKQQNHDQIFQEMFLDKLNQSQQKLVDIYITRKRQIQQQKEQD